MLPNLLYLSPSPNLNQHDTVVAACDVMFPSSRSQAQLALSNLDSRVFDIVTASSMRSNALLAIGRFVDAWNENSLSVGMAWATGLGKLGHVLDEFVPPAQRPPDRAARLEHERRVRTIRAKGQIAPPPSDVADCAQRIRSFWSMYFSDRANGFGWHWPCSMDLSEITTPLPRDSYETTADLLDNSTIAEFMAGRGDSHGDSVFALQIKAITLLYEASRLLDKPPEIATPDKTAHLRRVTERLMASMPAYTATTRDEAIRTAGINDTWIALHSVMSVLAGKDEVDATTQAEADAARDKGIEASLSMCECIDAAVAAGDTQLEGCDLLALNVWCITGRTMWHYVKRIQAADPARAQLLKDKVRMLVEVSRKVVSNKNCTESSAQMLT